MKIAALHVYIPEEPLKDIFGEIEITTRINEKEKPDLFLMNTSEAWLLTRDLFGIHCPRASDSWRYTFGTLSKLRYALGNKIPIIAFGENCSLLSMMFGGRSDTASSTFNSVYFNDPEWKEIVDDQAFKDKMPETFPIFPIQSALKTTVNIDRKVSMGGCDIITEITPKVLHVNALAINVKTTDRDYYPRVLQMTKNYLDKVTEKQLEVTQ